MSDHPFDSLETVLECLKKMESILMGLKQLREYVGKGLAREMLDSLIEEADSQITLVKQKLMT